MDLTPPNPTPPNLVPQPFRHDLGIIGTILICPEKTRMYPHMRRRYTRVISLEHCEEFIKLRFENYSTQKTASRLMFPDELIQYLAWKSGIALQE